MCLLRVLLDSGGTGTMIHRRILSKKCTPSMLSKTAITKIIEGKFESKNVVTMKKLIFPEFDKNKVIDEQMDFVFDSKCKYDIILGCDFCIWPALPCVLIK